MRFNISIKNIIEKIGTWFKDKWSDFKDWWFYNLEIFNILFCVILFVGVIPIGSLCAYDYYMRSNYDFTIHSNCRTIWVNENKIERKGDTLIITDDDEIIVLTTYSITDNRKN